MPKRIYCNTLTSIAFAIFIVKIANNCKNVKKNILVLHIKL